MFIEIVLPDSNKCQVNIGEIKRITVSAWGGSIIEMNNGQSVLCRNPASELKDYLKQKGVTCS